MTQRWLLPEYLEDLLPVESWRLEQARRILLDLFRARGFELVMPSLVEYMESLQTGTGRDMDLLTFRLVDQLSGRQLGIRADITLQAARLDAHDLSHPGANRLCYAGTVLHARPSGLGRSRELFQVGAEIYGNPAIEADLEVVLLMLAALRALGLPQVTLDVGHAGLFRVLGRAAGLDEQLEAAWFDALLQKDIPSLRQLAQPLSEPWRQLLPRMALWNGGVEVLEVVRSQLPSLPELAETLRQLEAVAHACSEVAPVNFDLAALEGYHYHSGLIFAAYAPGFADAVARGGRYDSIGRAFGRARAATGFSLDLRELLPVLSC